MTVWRLLRMTGAAMLLVALGIAAVNWMTYGETGRSLGLDLPESAQSAAEELAGDRGFLIVREDPQIFVDSFDEIDFGKLARRAFHEKYVYMFSRPQRTYHFRITVEGKSYYWSFRERSFLPTVKPGIWDTDESLLVHMRNTCSFYSSLPDTERSALFEQTERYYGVRVTLAGFCRD